MNTGRRGGTIILSPEKQAAKTAQNGISRTVHRAGSRNGRDIKLNTDVPLSVRSQHDFWRSFSLENYEKEMQMEQKRVAIFGASVRGLAGMAIQYFHNRKSKLNGAVKQEDKPEELAEDADNVSDNDDLM